MGSHHSKVLPSSGEGHGRGGAAPARKLAPCAPARWPSSEEPSPTAHSQSGLSFLTDPSTSWSACSMQEHAGGSRRCAVDSQDVASLLKEVELGPVVGCWGNSLCYRARFQHRSVAVMITDHLAEDEAEAAQLEATLRRVATSPELEHPNLVKVLHMAIERPALQEDLIDNSGHWDADPWGGPGDTPRSPALPCLEAEDWLAGEDGLVGMEGLEGAGEAAPWAASHSRRRHLQVWMISELCGQGTLEAGIARGWLRQGSSALGRAQHASDLPAVLTTAREIAAALSHLHRNGLVHNSLNGQSVLLFPAPGDERSFTAKLSSACHLVCQTSQRGTQTLRLDTAAHTAPEVLLGGQERETPATNAYSFGVLLHEMYSGALAWDFLKTSQLMRDLMARRPVLPPLPNCPPALQALVSACVAPDAADRPSFDAILACLDQLLAESKEA